MDCSGGYRGLRLSFCQNTMTFQRAAKQLGNKKQQNARKIPLAVKRANGAKMGPANSRASAKKRQTAPQLPCSLAEGCLLCKRDTAGRWEYGGKVCGNKKCRLVNGVLLGCVC